MNEQQTVSVDTIIAEASLGVSEIVGNLCRTLKSQVVEVTRLRTENTTLKSEIEKLKAVPVSEEPKPPSPFLQSLETPGTK